MAHIVLVCGGRDFSDRDFIFAALDRFNAKFGISCLVHGAARGVDSIAGEWAASNGLPVKSFPAEWGKHGKAAGPIRNQRMIDEGRPTAVIAFPGGRGTADMSGRARARGITVYRPA